MIKVRTAKQTFKDTLGNQVNAGERFGIVELRPLFVSRSALQSALSALDRPATAETPKEPQK